MPNPSSWIEYLKTVDSPTLANAIELLEVRGRHEGFLPVDFKCMFPEFGRTIGYAVTAQVETITRQEEGGPETFVDLFKLVDASPKPAIVVLQEMGPHGNYAAHSGEVMATIFTRLGAVGLVSDCAVRDLPEVRAMGFQYFARGAVVSHAWFRIVRSGVPGITTLPGAGPPKRGAYFAVWSACVNCSARILVVVKLCRDSPCVNSRLPSTRRTFRITLTWT